MDVNDFERVQRGLHLVRVDPANACVYLSGLRPSGMLSLLEAQAVVDELSRGIGLLKENPAPVATPEHRDFSTIHTGANV